MGGAAASNAVVPLPYGDEFYMVRRPASLAALHTATCLARHHNGDCYLLSLPPGCFCAAAAAAELWGVAPAQ